ncbi:hypothetical protein HY933_01575, partial [Candidatus Falkowbacteria bacterium]|nr:hypothetical protein [Candidatus Falkowbacteria bacterium]
KGKVEGGAGPDLDTLHSSLYTSDSLDFEDIPVEDIEIGDEVLTLDEKDGTFVWQKVEDVMDKGFQTVFELITESGKTIETTEEHPYFIKKESTLLEGDFAGNKKQNNCDDKNTPRDTRYIQRHYSFTPFNKSNNTDNAIIPLPIYKTRDFTVGGFTKAATNQATAMLEKNPANAFTCTTFNGNSIGNTVSQNQYKVKTTWKKVKELTPGTKIATINGWEKIVSITKTGRKHTYDLQIANTHNFVGNGIVAHNTTGRALTILNETGDQAIFTASASGTPVFTLGRTGIVSLNQNSQINTAGTLLMNSTGTLSVNTTNNAAITTGTGLTTLGGNLTLAGTITLPNSNTITGVTNYTQVSGGVSVGGATTYYVNSSGTGNLNALTLAGNLTLNSNVASNIIPSATNTYDLGSTTKYWNNLYANNITSSGQYGGLWQRNSGVLSPINITDDLLVGTTATPSSATSNYFQVLGSGSTSGDASSSGSLVLGTNRTSPTISTRSFKNLTLGDSQTGNVILSPGTGKQVQFFSGSNYLDSSGNLVLAGNITIPGTTTLNGIAYTWPSSGQSAGYALTTNGSGALSWAAASGLGTNYWTLANGSLYPVNATVDLLVGGSATTSAKFAFINVASGTPTASVSGNLTLDAAGVIATTKMQQLTLGSATTGPIQLSPKGTTGLFVDATGQVGIGTTGPLAKLDVNGTASISGALSLYGTPTIASTAMKSLTLGDANTGNIFLSPASATPTVVVTTGGQVGIGTTSPLTKLHVEGACVTGDTLIRRRRKKSKVKSGKGKVEGGAGPDLDTLHSSLYTSDSLDFEDVPVTEIEPGDEILSLDEKTGTFVTSKVRQLMNMGVKQIFELTTEDGKTIKTTEKHPYLVHLAEEKISSTNFFYYQFFEEAQTAARQLYRQAFEGKTVCVPALNNEPITFGHEGWNHLMQEKRSRFDLLTRFFALPKIFAVLERAKKAEKEAGKIHKEITFWTLQGIVDGVWVKVIIRSVNNGPKYFYSVVWKGEEYRQEVKAAIKKGAVSRLYPRRQASGKTLAFSTDFFKELSSAYIPQGQGMVTLQFLNDRIVNQRNRFVKQEKWIMVNKLKTGMKIATLGADGRMNWQKIKSIKKLSEEQVYDLEIENTHNFVGNGIVAHNTTGKALFMLNETGDQDLFTASASGTTRLKLTNAGNLTFNQASTISTSGSNNLTLTAGGNLVLTNTTVQLSGGSSMFDVYNASADTTLTVSNSSASVANLSVEGQIKPGTYTSNPTQIGNGAIIYRSDQTQLYYYNGSAWTAIGSGSGGSLWRIISGALSPLNDTLDVLIGNSATSSAKFAFLNVATGTPTASVSAGAAGATYLTADGVIATTAKQSLTLGNSTTGNIILNGGNVGISNTTPAVKLDITSGNIRLSDTQNIQWGGATNFLTGSNASNYLAVSTNNTERARIDSAGLLGIGTTSPISRTQITNNPSTLTGKAALLVDQYENQDLVTASASGTTRFYVTNSGDMVAQRFADLANTTYLVDPAATGNAAVNIAGGVTTGTGILTSGVANSSTAVGFTLNTASLTTQGAKLLSLQNASTEKFYVDKDGNLYAAGTILSGNGSG